MFKVGDKVKVINSEDASVEVDEYRCLSQMEGRVGQTGIISEVGKTYAKEGEYGYGDSRHLRIQIGETNFGCSPEKNFELIN